jgi:serine/threonine-protein kinase RsbW
MSAFRLQVPAELGSLSSVGELCGLLAAQAALGDRDTARLRSAVDELITNVITHGYREDPTRVVRLVASVEDYRVVVTIVDDAPAFDPLAHAGAEPDWSVPGHLRPLGGNGLALARRAVDRIAYQRVGTENQTTIEVSGRPAAPCAPPRTGTRSSA